MKWKVRAFAWNDSTTQREIRSARSRKFKFRLNAPSTISFSMNGLHPESLWITELVTDIIVSADGVDIARMRTGNTQDSVSETTHGVSFNFADYRAVLQRRKLRTGDTLSWTAGTEQSDIVWQMIQAIQGRTNGNYGITRGAGAVTGVLRQLTSAPGKYVGKEIDSMAKLANGFDWDITHDMIFNVHFPQRGVDQGISIESGKSIQSYTRNVTPGDFANDILTTGANTTLPVEDVSPTIATDPRGRWDDVYSYPDISLQASLDERGDWLLPQAMSITPVYSVVLRKGFWEGPSHIGLGDTIMGKFKSGRIDESPFFRVVEIGVDLDDDEEETEEVRLGLSHVA